MFCFLAGAMITVSATAIGVWFSFPMPELNDVYPNSVAWAAQFASVAKKQRNLIGMADFWKWPNSFNFNLQYDIPGAASGSSMTMPKCKNINTI